ncbi:MAG: hypothetical protein QF569_02670 [Candidatus Poribacteria bacterium]|nr:hypothetical protein [Candidatus Poribacteria bacterium]
MTVDHLNRVADGRKRPVLGNRHGKKVCGGGKRIGDGKGDYNTSEVLGAMTPVMMASSTATDGLNAITSHGSRRS